MTPALAFATIVAGGLGATARYLLTRLLPGGSVGWPVLTANLLASFLVGLAVASWSAPVALVVATGFCGGLSTYSTFAVETVEAADRHARGASVLARLAANVLLGLLAAFAGIVLAGVLSPAIAV